MSDDTLASDAERERAVARLRDASAEGRLTLEELATRTDAAYAARTHAELVRATAGLPAATQREPATRGRPRAAAGLFVPVTLDLRGGDVSEAKVLALFAPVEVVVPADADVHLDTLGIFAPVRERGRRGTPPPGARRIRVRGIALFAPVVVRHEPS